MPLESRTLHFANDEIYEALREYCVCSGRAIPENATCKLAPTGEAEVRVNLNSPAGESTTSFTESELGAALIMFCIKKSIPIARRSLKTLQVDQDRVSLHMEIQAQMS